MEQIFINNQAYILSKNIYRLIQFHIKKESFNEYETLKRRMEKLSLCIISIVVKTLLHDPGEEKKKSLFRSSHLAYSLLAMYDLSRDLKLIDKKDFLLAESALKELIEEIKKI